MSISTLGGYVRHRDRMVQESVFEDLRDTLIAGRWLAGSTAQPVWDPDVAPPAPWASLTHLESDLMPLLEGHPVNLIDFFPEAEGKSVAGDPARNRIQLNTFALDNGTVVGRVPLELGSNSEIVAYRFNMALYASSDAVAQAMLGDLTDRYRGHIIRPEVIDLWNFVHDMSAPVTRMSVESFSYELSADTGVSVPNEAKLYFGELMIEDVADAIGGAETLPGGGRPGGPAGLQTGQGDPNTLGVAGEAGEEYVDLTTGNLFEWRD